MWFVGIDASRGIFVTEEAKNYIMMLINIVAEGSSCAYTYGDNKIITQGSGV